MNRARRDGMEWGLIALVWLACLTLGWLEVRWTTSRSRAEVDRVRSTTAAQLRQLGQTFDAELRRAVRDFVPPGEAVERLGWRRANLERIRQAQDQLDRPMFARIGAAVPNTQGGLDYWDGVADGERPWPPGPAWEKLRARLTAVHHGTVGHHHALVDPQSTLIEVPVFGEERELEWMLFELNEEYARQTWIPELARATLGTQDFRVEVNATGTIDAEARLFPLGYIGRRGDAGRWRLAAVHVAGSIENAVRNEMRTNLALALVLLGLIAAAGTALVHYARRARQLSAAQLRFVTGVSHELRTPLTVIQGAGHNLLSGVVKDEAQRESYARAIVKQASQLGEMVDLLLSYGSIQNHGRPVEMRPVELGPVVSEAIEAVAMELEQSGRRVDVNIPADLPAVRGEETALRRVFWNLIGNAIRHGAGEIQVSGAEAASCVEVRVRDEGEGIPEEEQRLIFDPFFRGSRARTGRVRGTGLGLSLVKETVEAAGGKVTVESAAGQGTEFVLRWPKEAR